MSDQRINALMDVGIRLCKANDEINRLRAVVADVARWVPADACLDTNTWDALRPHRTPTERHEARR